MKGFLKALVRVFAVVSFIAAAVCVIAAFRTKLSGRFCALCGGAVPKFHFKKDFTDTDDVFDRVYAEDSSMPF